MELSQRRQRVGPRSTAEGDALHSIHPSLPQGMTRQSTGPRADLANEQEGSAAVEDALYTTLCCGAAEQRRRTELSLVVAARQQRPGDERRAGAIHGVSGHQP